MKQISTLFLLMAILFQSAAFAEGKNSNKSGVYFESTFFPNLVYKNDTSSYTDSPGAAVENGMGFNTKTTLGAVLWGSLFVGATYNMDTLSTKRSNRSGGDSGLKEKTEETQLGATIGWIPNNWRFFLTGFLSGEKTVDTKNFDDTGVTGNKKITNKEASGMQLLVGYAYPLSQSFSMGPTLSYRSVTYAKQSKINRLNSAENYSNTALFTEATENKLDMMFTLIFRF